MNTDDLETQLDAIRTMSWSELRQRWREMFGEEPRSSNTAWMRKRLIWSTQAAIFGGLSDAAKQRIEELTPLALAWLPMGKRSFPTETAAVSPVKRDRLSPGTIITRVYRGRTLELVVREDGRFELDGVIHSSLTAAARAATGSTWNGPLFWLGRNGKRESA